MVRQTVNRLAREFHPSRLLPSLSLGLVVGALDIAFEVSFAALIFSGDLSGYMARGIGMTLFAAMVVSLVMAVTSSLPGVVALPQDSPAALLAVAAAAILASMPATATAESTFFTIVATIALASLVSGLFFLLLGQLRQGNLVRYIPYPVIGGFLAGTGWLLFNGGFGVAADLSLSLGSLATLFQPDMLLRWLPSLLFAILLLLILRRRSHFLILPALIAAAIGLFYAVLGLSGLSVDEACARGWLLGPFPEGALWQPLTPAALQQVEWPLVLGQMGGVGTLLVIGVVSLLLNASGLELVARRGVDLNRELKSAGLANCLAGLGGGGPTGYHALSLSALSYRGGIPSRWVGVTVAMVLGSMLFLGPAILVYFPKPVLGGLVIFLGLDFMVEWLYDGWSKLSKADYAIVVLIMVAMITIGVLEGVGLGIVLAVILFAVEYSRVRVVRHELSGATFQSNVDRPRLYQQLLRQKGEWLYILELQGFLFFGTANRLLDRVRQRLQKPGAPKLRWVVLDFRRVSGLDASAELSFVKMKQLARAHDLVLVFTDLAPRVRQQLEKEVLGDEDRATWRVFADLDRGVEWCEAQMIQVFESVGLAPKRRNVMRQLEEFLSRSARCSGWQDLIAQDAPPAEEASVHSALTYMERMEVEAGEVLVRQGERFQGLYFVESGQVTIQVEAEDGRTVRLRTKGADTIAGETGLYLGTPAEASVVAEERSTIYALSTEALQCMEAEDPEMAAAFHRFIAQDLSARLQDTTRTLRALME